MKLIARVEDNWRQKEIEEDGILERHHALNHHPRTHPDNQPHNHPFHQHATTRGNPLNVEGRIGRGGTPKNRHDGFMDSTNLFQLQIIAHP